MGIKTGDKQEIRTYTAGIEVREEGDGQTVTGHAAVFNSESKDLGGFTERVAPGAFRRTLSEARSGERKVMALWNHDAGMPLGSVAGGKLDLSEDREGLKFELRGTRLTPAQIDAINDGDMDMSFGFRAIKEEWEEREDQDPLRTLMDVDLLEISIVAFPAYDATDVALRSLEEWRTKQEPAAPPPVEKPKQEEEAGRHVAELKREMQLKE